jgi:hypothetical protein
MAVRAGFGASGRFVANVEVSPFAALLHAVGGHAVDQMHGRCLLRIFQKLRGFYDAILSLFAIRMMTQACAVKVVAGNCFAAKSNFSCFRIKSVGRSISIVSRYF